MSGPSGSSDPAPIFLAADFHLDGGPEGRDRLALLPREAARAGARLILLGDLFNYWYGRQHLELDMYRHELDLLRGATGAGLEIDIIVGNRDYLLDERFSEFTGVRVHPEEYVLELPDARIHLSHGDLYATDDRGYLLLRRILRSRMLLFLAHHAPCWLVRFVANRIRHRSKAAVREKTVVSLEPDLEAVRQVLDRGHDVVICGHFHRAWDEAGSTSGGAFMILEPFEETGFVLVRDGSRWEPRRLARPNTEEVE